MRLNVLFVALLAAVAVLFVGCSGGGADVQSSVNASSSSAPSQETVSASSVSQLSSSEADSAVATLNLGPLPAGDVLSGLSPDVPQEMSPDQAERVLDYTKAAAPREGHSLLANAAKHFYYQDRVDADAASLYEGYLGLLADPSSHDAVVAVPIAPKADSESLAAANSLAYLAVLYDHPELFGLFDGLEARVEVGFADGKAYLSWDKEYKRYEEQATAFSKEAETFLADIDLKAPDYEVALAIHDKLMRMVSYDYEAAEAGSKDLAHTAYGALVANSAGQEHRATSDGYALAYEYLLQQAGIEAAVLVGEASEGTNDPEPHAWNIVKLGGSWYEVDVSWDDAVSEWRDVLAEYESKDPGNEAIPYYREALDDEAYYDLATHFLYNVTTAEITDYVPSSVYTYYFQDGKSLSLIKESSHIRAGQAQDSEVRETYAPLTALAPEATGTKYAYTSR